VRQQRRFGASLAKELAPPTPAGRPNNQDPPIRIEAASMKALAASPSNYYTVPKWFRQACSKMVAPSSSITAAEWLVDARL